jgi:amino acid adenylation domain-containing protein
VGRDPETAALDLLEVIARQVARRPDHPAVEGPDATLTYAALDRTSNQLARHLVSLGVGRDACVGVSLPRGAAELLVMLATLKAGGAYVPLDPAHPIDRLRMILDDSAPPVLVVHPGSPLAGAAPATTRVVELTDPAPLVAAYDAAPLATPPDPAQLAYVLFTSGSTGRPKGVEIPRGAFANFLRSMMHEPGMSEDDRLLAVSTTSFDIAGLELFLPLCVGATTVIADRATVIDPRRLRAKLEASAISFMQATPATWRLLLDTGWRGRDGLRLLCGGEAMSAALADRLLAGGNQLWNMYGPTETTVWSTLQRIEPGYDVISIGRPIDRTQIHVLDEQRQPVAAGEVGELYIGGHGLARGYRGRADLTAERFIQNPGGPADDRIYRTGDLGRMMPDGRFECLGRIDHQVKIRGYRIELGEIESVLRQAGDVGEVLVVAEDQDGDPRLAAYWVGGAKREALIDVARRRLPAYMVPSAYVHLDAFPLSPNGKIDRKRLPRSTAAPQPVPTLSLNLPRNDAETRIAALWTEILGVGQVGVDQDFFSVGGTSVLAIALRERIRRDMGVELPMTAFFESPTVGRQASHIGNNQTATSLHDAIVVQLRRSRSTREPLFCLLGVHLYQELALMLAGDRPVIGVHRPFLHIPGVDRRPSVPEMAAGYLELIRQHQPHGPYHLAGLCFGGIVAYEAARQLEAQGERVALVAVFDGILPRAIRTNAIDRLRSYTRTALTEPRQIPTFIRETLDGVTARAPWLRRLRPLPPASRQPIDVSIDGAEADAEVARFASTISGIAGQLLIIRATAESQPSWMEVSADLGWTGLSDRLTVRDVAATHMELLRRPHVREVAGAIDELIDGDAAVVVRGHGSAAASR